MTPATKVRGVLSLVAVGVVVLLDKVGDFGTLSWLFSLLPTALQQRLMTNQAAAIFAGICFALAFWVLWRDAGKGAKALASVDAIEATAKESNARAWQFSAEMKAFEDKVLARQKETEVLVQTVADGVSNLLKGQHELKRQTCEDAKRAAQEAIDEAGTKLKQDIHAVLNSTLERHFKEKFQDRADDALRAVREYIERAERG